VGKLILRYNVFEIKFEKAKIVIKRRINFFIKPRDNWQLIMYNLQLTMYNG